MSIAVFPGSFDPVTIGHEAIIRRSLTLFNTIIIGIGYNSEKKGFYPIEKRKTCLENVFADEKRIQIEIYEGLTIDFCKKMNAKFLLRGLRNSTDFQYEQTIAQMNMQIAGIETVLLMTAPELSAITSTVIRDIARHGGDISAFVPKAAIEIL